MHDTTDVLIVGGGCNGTGLARDLSKRGLRVVLCEKGDLARGATGASSAMIHGGPRYLLNDVETTRHSCTDSGYIQRIAPHMLFRIPFIMPVPHTNPFKQAGLLLHDVYFDVYDRYAALKNGIPHACLTIAQMHALEPGLHGHFLGGVTLDEWGIDPGRLCVFNALDAAYHGAQIHTHTEVVDLIRDAAGSVMGAQVRPAGQVNALPIHARVVVNCGGPWATKVAALAEPTNEAKPVPQAIKLRPGKGVHLIYARRLTNYAILTEAIDGRQVFVMPYQNETWVGTTDDDYYGDLDHLQVTQNEVSYLRDALERILPDLAQQRLIGTRVGVRNTMFGWGQPADALSRGYQIVDHAMYGVPNLFSLLGGKLASYRIQSEELADAVCKHLQVTARCHTHEHALPGGTSLPNTLDLAQEYGISPLAAKRLIFRHGQLAIKVLDIGKETKTGFHVVDAAEPVLECEIRYCIRHEYVVNLADLMSRCRLAMGADMGLHSARRAAELYAQERSLDVTCQRQALHDLLNRRWHTAQAVLTAEQLPQAELLLAQYAGLWQPPHHPLGDAHV